MEKNLVFYVLFLSKLFHRQKNNKPEKETAHDEEAFALFCVWICSDIEHIKHMCCVYGAASVSKNTGWQLKRYSALFRVMQANAPLGIILSDEMMTSIIIMPMIIIVISCMKKKIPSEQNSFYFRVYFCVGDAVNCF